MKPLNDLMLNELYRSPRDQRAHQLAARYAPILRFDAREPFLPAAAGITLFEADGPSPSMKRTIQLAPPGKPAAAAALEYAIWWDWDIHHLYELEHIWVYLDGQGQVLRVEASWHGKFNQLALQLEGEHPVVLSQPGKHAFASQPEPFLQQARERRRSETRYVSALAHVLINDMFNGRIRRRPFDNSLARSFLVNQAFDPSWDFSQIFRFAPDWLVPWPALKAWIPRRVNAWLEQLDNTLEPQDYRALRFVSCSGTPQALEAAQASGVDGVVLPVISGSNGHLATGSPGDSGETASLAEVFQFCRSVPMRALLEVQDEGCLEVLAAFLNDKKLHALAPVTAANPGWLAKLKTLAPHAWVIAQLGGPSRDPLAAAAACQAAGVLPRWEQLSGAQQILTPAWVERVHAAGLTVMSWPLASAADGRALERQRLDAVWIAD